MPCLKLKLSIALPQAAGLQLMQQLSSQLASVLDKPEAYVQVLLEESQQMLMAGETKPTALAELYSIGGLTPEINRAVSALLAAQLQEYGIQPERLYLMLFDIEPTHFGWKGSTFG